MVNAHVLLVDDNIDFVNTMAERLRMRELKVSTATNGRDALEMVDCECFDAVVLDMQMPGLDGIETLKRIKAKNDEVQIIILSGHATVQISVEAMKLGALDFMEKPVDMDALLERIRKAQAKRAVLQEKHNEEKIQDILARRF
ncbi:response regulator [Desulfobaculum sp. SPO524]|uniref:response regulator n=1 Tax=Desulfobaculum sp. SPO524 TaxID=3378071 RepID=UPI0038554BFD